MQLVKQICYNNERNENYMPGSDENYMPGSDIS